MSTRALSVGEHLTELRRRLIVSVAAVIVGTVAAFVFHPLIFKLLMGPAQGFESLQGNKLIFTQATEMIGITMKVSMMGGLALASPVVLYQVVMFVAPGLTPREKRYLFALLPGVILSFAAGASFGYLVLLPPAINFLLTFGSDIATPMIRVGKLHQPGGHAAVLAWRVLPGAAGDVLPEQDTRGDAESTGEAAAVRHRGGVHSGRADHADVRSGQPDHGGGADTAAVRAGHLAGPAGAPGRA